MANYRLYSVDAAGRISAPPAVIECATDAQAVAEAKAKALILGLKVEVWQGDRVVAVLPAVA